MKPNREALVKALKTLLPAIDSNNAVESYHYFWFDGPRGVAFAYNGVVGIEVPLQVEIDGGLPAAFLDLMNKSTATEVELVMNGKELAFRAGSSKGTMPTHASDACVQPFPPDDMERLATVELVKDSTAALKHVMLTQDSLKTKEFMGVTIMPDGSDLKFYSTDGNSLSWASMPLPPDYNAPRITLTPEFCSRLLGVSGGDCVLEVFDDCAIANFEGNVRVFGRLIGEETERDFAGRIKAAVPAMQPCSVPDLFKEALDRVIVICGSAVAKVLATVDGKDMSLTCKGQYGELAEQFALNSHVQKISTQLDARLLTRALSGGGPAKFIIGPRACWIASDTTGFGNVSGAVH